MARSLRWTGNIHCNTPILQRQHSGGCGQVRFLTSNLLRLGGRFSREIRTGMEGFAYRDGMEKASFRRINEMGQRMLVKPLLQTLRTEEGQISTTTPPTASTSKTLV